MGQRICASWYFIMRPKVHTMQNYSSSVFFVKLMFPRVVFHSEHEFAINLSVDGW